MNTANVMPVQVQTGGQGKTQGAARATQSGKAASKQSFGETMGRLDQQGRDAIGAAAGDTQPDTAGTGAVVEDTPQDSLALVLAASLQGNGNLQADVEQTPPESEVSAAVLIMSAEPQDAFVNQAVMTDNNPADLQSLIPQSAEDVARNRDFLAMLAGQQLKAAGTEQSAQAGGSTSSRFQQAATMLESQLLNRQNVQNAAENQLQQESLTVLSEQPVSQQFAETVSQPTFQQTVSRQPTLQTLTQSRDTQKAETEMLAGVSLSVEDETVLSPIRMDAQQAMNQQNPQSEQQNAAQQEFADQADSGAQILTENAAMDSLPTGSTDSSQNTGNVSLFQQSLQNSITGTAGDKTAETAQPQTDFDIPRQIVDQARLIRRAEDTQMVIKLNPEHLGELTLKVSVTQNGSVNAAFHSDNAQVRAIIENSLVQLRQELNDQGLKVDSVEVYAGLADGQLPQEQGQQTWQNQQGSNHSIRALTMDADEYAEEAESLAAAVSQGTGETAMDGVDYRI